MAGKSFWTKFKEAAVGTSVEERLANQPYRAEVVSSKGVPSTREQVPVSKSGRSSVPNFPIDTLVTSIAEQYRVVNPEWVADVIPVIRKLCKVNPDMSQALDNIVTLGNTGHKIFFDRKVPQPQVDKMRSHLANRQLDWAAGQAGMNGLVNKMFSQLLIGGALSNEWIPNMKLDGVETVILVNPEDIRFKLKKGNTKYVAYQQVKNSYLASNAPLEKGLAQFNLIELNPQTYKYYALNGDTEIPYGCPPYLAALDGIETQKNMNKNINFVVDQLGLLGFLHTLIGKPDQLDGEGDAQYQIRLDQLLDSVKIRMQDGIKDGAVVGFQDDANFEYHTISKGFADALAIFKNNELQIASGLKQDATLWGRDYNTSETQITVIFIKMLSQLANIQNIVKTDLEFGYALDLRLAGFAFDSLEVKFNKSTLQDDLKFQQADEIKVRNVKDKMIMGIISQEQAADELGYELPAFPKPNVSWDVLAGGSDPVPAAGGVGAKKAKRQGQKNKSAKKTRDTNKPIPKNK